MLKLKLFLNSILFMIYEISKVPENLTHRIEWKINKIIKSLLKS